MICLGTTAKNQPCKKTVSKGEYCNIHRHQSVNKERKPVKEVRTKKEVLQEIPKKEVQEDVKLVTCPICLDDVECDLLSCGHAMHKPCISNMNDMRCPICREPMILPDSVKSKIKKNSKRYREELLEEQRHFPFPTIPFERLDPFLVHLIRNMPSNLEFLYFEDDT